MAVFNRVYSPLGTQISMLVAEGSLKQDYDADNKIYTPDRRIRPTAIQPVCSITDPSGILENGTVNLYITDIKWYENEISEANLISPTNSKYKIDSTSNTNNRGRIIVYKNVNFDAPVTLIFTATFADMVNGKLRRKAYFVGTSVLASNVAASSPAVLKTDYPRGRCFNPIKGLTYLKLSADLVAGETSIPSAYWWYKKNGSAESLITDYVGHNSRELEVPTASIGKEQHYVCKVQDCRQNLTDVRNEYLQKELDKISDYPRNLLAKQYFLDLNDEIKPGVVTEGEDADGKYICIPNPVSLYNYVGQASLNDLFNNKIAFKENTAYLIRSSGKYIYSGEGDKTGFRLLVFYTDGIKMQINIGGAKCKKDIAYLTDGKKTISHISSAYGYDITSYIYDIQITEKYNYNLLQGDTKKLTIVGGELSTAYGIRALSTKLAVGKKYTIKVDDIESTSGIGRVVLYQRDGIDSTVSNGLTLGKDSKSDIFIVNEKYDPNVPVSLYLYANSAGNSAGHTTTYKNVQLLEGEYAWNVLGEDIEEVTIESGEILSQYAKINIPNKLQVGGKYTLEVGDIINIIGAPDMYTVRIYQFNNMNVSVSNQGELSQDKKNFIFTIKDNYNPDLPVYLLLYAGSYGSTKGNVIQYKNIRLLYGETVLPSMPSYTPHFIPSAPDIEVESERITLPEGYRPDVQGKTINHEFTLVTRLPPYRTSVVTPYGNDSEVISIPSDVKLFPAGIQVDVAGIGTLDNPERYFSADWGNGLKGMNVLLDADDIGLGVQEVEPDVVEGMEHVKYGLTGRFNMNIALFEYFSAGTKIIYETQPCIITEIRTFSIRKGGYGVYSSIIDNKIYAYVVFGNKIHYASLNNIIKNFPNNVPHRLETIIGKSLDTCKIMVDGIEYIIKESASSTLDGDSMAYLQPDRACSLIEIYQDDTLLHKWDFEGSTSAERLSDKAETENKISIVMGDGSEFIPV